MHRVLVFTVLATVALTVRGQPGVEEFNLEETLMQELVTQVAEQEKKTDAAYESCNFDDPSADCGASSNDSGDRSDTSLAATRRARARARAEREKLARRETLSDDDGLEEEKPADEVVEDPVDSMEVNRILNKNLAAYKQIVTEMEQLTNDWCCYVSEKASPLTGPSMQQALYTVPGDKDVFGFIYYALGRAFAAEGQEYGNRIILQYHGEGDEPSGFKCETALDDRAYEYPLRVLLRLREGIDEWLGGNGVDAKPILKHFLPLATQQYAEFVRSRMMYLVQKRKDGPIAALSTAVLAVAPLYSTENPLNHCQAGADFLEVVGRHDPIYRGTIQPMIDGCSEYGKLAENPAAFGEVLRSVGRESEARALFKLAVERGALCNPWQRPEAHHRKDLPPTPIYDASQVSAAAKALVAVRKRFEEGRWMKAKADEPEDEFVLPNEFSRVPLWGLKRVDAEACAAFGGDEACRAVQDAAYAIEATNDGYESSCNSSLTIEVWTAASRFKTKPEVGMTNLVVQMLLPLRLRSSLAVHVGEDTAQLFPSMDEPLIFDDSFEHSFEFLGDGSGDGRPELLLHAQICNPDLHARALDEPPTQCADTE